MHFFYILTTYPVFSTFLCIFCSLFYCIFLNYQYNYIVEKIKKFNQDQINSIKKFWSVDCKHLDSYDAKHQCPVCKKKYKRLPDVNTFRELIMTYDATDTAWAEVFKTDRSSVTKIRNKVNPKNKSSVWDRERFENENKFYKYQDKKPVQDFLYLLKNFPRSTENQLLKISELTNEYLKLVLENDNVLKSEYETVTQFRASKETGGDYLYCVKCKIRKSVNKFEQIGNEKVYSKICSYCAADNLARFDEWFEKKMNGLKQNEK